MTWLPSADTACAAGTASSKTRSWERLRHRAAPAWPCWAPTLPPSREWTHAHHLHGWGMGWFLAPSAPTAEGELRVGLGAWLPVTWMPLAPLLTCQQVLPPTCMGPSAGGGKYRTPRFSGLCSVTGSETTGARNRKTAVHWKKKKKSQHSDQNGLGPQGALRTRAAARPARLSAETESVHSFTLSSAPRQHLSCWAPHTRVRVTGRSWR